MTPRHSVSFRGPNGGMQIGYNRSPIRVEFHSHATSCAPTDLDPQRLIENVRAWLAWLSPEDFSAKQDDLRAEWPDNAGRWLLDDARFQQWVRSEPGILFCYGIPGAGKTMMAAAVVDHLFHTFRRRGSRVGIAYWYCTPQLRAQHLGRCFGSMLRQLMPRLPKLPRSMELMYADYVDRERRPSPAHVQEVLCEVITAYDRVFLVVDGIDELSGRQHSQQEMLDRLFALQERTQKKLNLLATSRPLPEIVARFEEKESVCIEIQAHQQDLVCYVRERLCRLPYFVRGNQELQQEVIKNVTQNVEGMFLLVQLRLHALASTTSVSMFRKKLRQFKEGGETCEDLYEHTMRRITHKDGGLRDDAWNVAQSAIFWVLWSRRELTIHEVRHAVAVHPDCNPISEDDIPHIDLILSLCGGLLQRGATSQNVEFVHSTARKYFEKTYSEWFPGAKDKIVKTCLTYLSYPAFTGVCKDQQSLQERLDAYPLYTYAAQNWGYHACQCSDSLTGYIKAFLAREAQVDACSQVLMLLTSNMTDRYASRQMLAPHLVAYFGLDRVAESMELSENPALNSPDADGRTPLLWAARNGHTEVLTMFLQMQNVDLNLPDKDGRTAFLWAAAKGHTAVLETLLATDQIDIYHEDVQRRNALTRAVINGRTEAVRLLLDRCRFDINSPDRERRTVLWWASAKGHGTILEQLLPRCTAKTVNRKDKHGWDALTRAVYRAHQQVVHVLLTSDAVEPDHSRKGHTPWWWAMKNKDSTIAKAFMDALDRKRIDANTICVGKRTALSWAAGMGCEEIVRELLDRTPEPDDLNTNNNGRTRTALSWATAGGCVSVVKLLLEARGINPNQADTKKRTPLWWAIANNKVSVVRLLLTNPAVDFNVKDSVGRTPLSLGAGLGRSAIVALLLLHRERLQIDVNATDKHGRTPLSWAARNGNGHVVQRLLEVDDVDPNAVDGLRRTPLMWAIINGHAEVAERVIIDGEPLVQLDRVDRKGRSALFWAAWAGDAATISLLSQNHGVDCNKRDRSNETALSVAIRKGYSESAQSLLRNYSEIEVNAVYKNGLTPLHLAAQRDDGATVNLLLQKGAGLDRCDIFGRTPLFLACGVPGRVLFSFQGIIDRVNPMLREESSLWSLLDADANMNHQTEDGWTPLHNACRKGDSAAVDALFLYGAKALFPDTQSKAPQPLALASRHGHLKVVERLLEHPMAQRMDLEKASKIARDGRHTEIYRLLQTHIAKHHEIQHRLGLYPKQGQ
ncbi:ankyrin [Aspergillus japonicus CBS 114.51]|uniref:Ankyrin n=1 Tax=Aspergillus japonicus CBS 114.51 TaxID=1448312 RepID=A0A8T8XGQ4_ASPJA|nr:ankyrin [Aspergillus japonicus CBS 114.51]RAH86964.1 ankyrin [Aspergillus japonicus CBS 114.51]